MSRLTPKHTDWDDEGDVRRTFRDAATGAVWNPTPNEAEVQRRTGGGSSGGAGCPLMLLALPVLLPLLMLRALVAMATTKPPARKRPPRLCRTREECWQAGWEDGADDPPMTEQQIAKLAPLWRLYVRRPNDPAA